MLAELTSLRQRVSYSDSLSAGSSSPQMQRKPVIDFNALDERQYFAQIAQRPGMFTGRVTYERMAQFLNGYDLGAQRAGGRGLEGIRDWLLGRLGHSSNLVWTSIVLQLTFPGQDQYPDTLTPEQDERALEVLFALLDEFLAERDASNDS